MSRLNDWLRTQDVDKCEYVAYCGDCEEEWGAHNHSWHQLITNGERCGSCGGPYVLCYQCPVKADDRCDWDQDTQSCLMLRLATQVVNREAQSDSVSNTRSNGTFTQNSDGSVVLNLGTQAEPLSVQGIQEAIRGMSTTGYDDRLIDHDEVRRIAREGFARQVDQSTELQRQNQQRREANEVTTGTDYLAVFDRAHNRS